ncbi:MAG: hypothetical protein AAGI91_06555 [Bacteroidota bacterium]
MKIPSQQTAAAAYTRVQTPPAQAAPPAPPGEAKAATEAPPAAGTPARTGGLSIAEQQMIDRYFPPRPEMTLRLYGPGREAQTVSPGALGGRLDLSA